MSTSTYSLEWARRWAKKFCCMEMGHIMQIRHFIHFVWLALESHIMSKLSKQNMLHVFTFYKNSYIDGSPTRNQSSFPRHAGWWCQPLWKIWKSIGIIIPNWMESHKIPWFQTPNQHVQPANPAYQLHPLTSSIWRKTGQYMKWVSKSASSRNREQLWGAGGPLW